MTWLVLLQVWLVLHLKIIIIVYCGWLSVPRLYHRYITIVSYCYPKKIPSNHPHSQASNIIISGVWY
jgi:hypothetical protein